MNEEAKQRAMDGLLREAGRRQPGVDEEFIEKALGKIDGCERLIGFRHFAYAAAACLVIGLTLYAFTFSKPEGEDVFVRIDSLVGEVLIDGELVTETISVKLPQKITCRDDAGVTVSYPDGTKVELSGGEYDLEFLAETQKSIRVHSGRALCSVKPQPKSTPLVFQTPHGEGEVLGTIFQVSVGEKNTRLQTVKGKVRVRKNDAGKPWTQVEAGYFANMEARDSVVAETMDVEALLPGDIIWAQEFGNEYGPEVDLSGTRMQLSEGGKDFWVMKSRYVPRKTQRNNWFPDQLISVELESREALFPAVEDMEIVLRMRAEKRGHCQVALLPVKRAIRKGHVITQEIDFSTEWRDVVLPLSDFLPWRKSRMPGKGTYVSGVAIWGFDGGSFQLDRVIVRRASHLP